MLSNLKKVSRQFPLVILVKVGWSQGRALESEEGKVWEVDCLSMLHRGKTEGLR
jgi:hypothetical protein